MSVILGLYNYTFNADYGDYLGLKYYRICKVLPPFINHIFTWLMGQWFVCFTDLQWQMTYTVCLNNTSLEERRKKETAEYNRLLRQFVGWTQFYLGTNFLDKTVFLQYLWHSLIETETNQVVIHPLTTLNITFNLFLIFDFLVSMFPATTIYNWQKGNAFKVQEWRKESSIVLYTK